MNLWPFIKVGAILALGFYFGHLSGAKEAAVAKTALEAQHAAQLGAAVTALDTQARQRLAAEAQLATVQNAYDAIKDIPDPVSVGLAHRVLYSSSSTCSDPMPGTATVAGGAPSATGSTIGPSEVERALNAYIQACGRDDKKLTAAQALAPPQSAR